MKIINIKIINPLGEILRDLNFDSVGLSFIYGDIKNPNNLGGTINSLGKTLLLKCIDYIYGANEDKKIIKEVIKDYVIEAEVLFEQQKYSIRRILGDSDQIYINNQYYPLADYKSFFHINRGLYSKQLVLSKKASELSNRTNPNKDDILNQLRLLNLEILIENVDAIYTSQDKIKEYKKNKKELVSFYGNIEIEQIDEEIFFIDKEVKRLTDEIDVISRKIKDIEISNIQKNIVEEYANKSKILKELSREYESKKIEVDRLIEFIDNSNKIDISSEHILAIFKKAKQEVPDMVKKKFYEVEEFHRKVYDERKEFLNSRVKLIEKKLGILEEKILVSSSEIDKLGKIISVNEVYQESIQLYEKYNNDLQELKFKEGKLSQVKNIEHNIVKEDAKLIKNYEKSNQKIKELNKLIKQYREFIYNITKRIYDKDVNSYFDIKIRKKNIQTRPVEFEFTLRGDTGEGVSEVKKNLIDLLTCKYNKQLDFLIMDSACFNGIDPRQVSGMLTELDKISTETQKQIIISINKYQLGSYDKIIDFVKKNSVVTLSEDDKLLRMDF